MPGVMYQVRKVRSASRPTLLPQSRLILIYVIRVTLHLFLRVDILTQRCLVVVPANEDGHETNSERIKDVDFFDPFGRDGVSFKYIAASRGFWLRTHSFRSTAGTLIEAANLLLTILNGRSSKRFARGKTMSNNQLLENPCRPS